MENESQMIREVMDLSTKVVSLWINGDLDSMDEFRQSSFKNKITMTKWLEENGFPIKKPKTHKIHRGEVVSEYAVDLYKQITGYCEDCEKDIIVQYKLRYIRESGPYKPDLNGKFGFNLFSITVLSIDGCQVRETADSEPIKKK